MGVKTQNPFDIEALLSSLTASGSFTARYKPILLISILNQINSFQLTINEDVILLPIENIIKNFIQICYSLIKTNDLNLVNRGNENQGVNQIINEDFNNFNQEVISHDQISEKTLIKFKRLMFRHVFFLLRKNIPFYNFYSSNKDVIPVRIDIDDEIQFRNEVKGATIQYIGINNDVFRFIKLNYNNIRKKIIEKLSQLLDVLNNESGLLLILADIFNKIDSIQSKTSPIKDAQNLLKEDHENSLKHEESPINKPQILENKYQDWLKKIIKNEYIPLFSTDIHGKLITRKKGNRTLLCRYTSMENNVQEETKKLVDDFKLNTQIYEGILCVMYIIKEGDIFPLFFTTTTKLGRDNTTLNGNLKDVLGDKVKNYFARWGDDSARHIGELSDAMFDNGVNPTPRKLKWRNFLFIEENNSFSIKFPIYFQAYAWKNGELDYLRRPSKLDELIFHIKEDFAPPLMGYKTPEELIIDIQKINNFELFFELNHQSEEMPQKQWSICLKYLYLNNDFSDTNNTQNEFIDSEPNSGRSQIISNDMVDQFKNILEELSKKLLSDEELSELSQHYFEKSFPVDLLDKNKKNLECTNVSKEGAQFFLFYLLPTLFYPFNIFCKVNYLELQSLLKIEHPRPSSNPDYEIPANNDNQFSLDLDFIYDFRPSIESNSQKNVENNFLSLDFLLVHKKNYEKLLNKKDKKKGLSEDKFQASEKQFLEALQSLHLFEERNPSSIYSSLFDLKPDYPSIDPPTCFKGKLYPFQKTGLGFLISLCDNNLGALLCDDMGLGKTYQIIAYLAHRLHFNKPNFCLIITPASVLQQWAEKLKELCPQLPVNIYQGFSRRIENSNSSSDSDKNPNQVILTTYNTFTRDFKIFQNMHFNGIILDEAHKIKNIFTRNAVAILQMHADFRVACTGTPIENKLLDLYPLMEFLNPGLLDSYNYFQKRYFTKLRGYKYEELLKTPEFNELKSKIGRFLLRRTKSELKSQNQVVGFPEQQITSIGCDMTDEQQILHAQIVKDYLVSDNKDSMSLLTKLKLVSDHPELFMPTYQRFAERSGKLSVMLELIEDILNKNENVVVYSQYVNMLNIMEKEIFRLFKINALVITGKMLPKKRYQIIQQANNERDQYPILLISLLAGGEGINLSGVKNLILFDSWWNYSKELQASDRINRIDQIHPEIRIWKLYSKNSIEEAILKLIEQKKYLLDSLIGDRLKMIEIEQILTEISKDTTLKI